MGEYDFAVEHRPGVRHTNADALSRHPCSVKSCVCKGHQLEGDYTVKAVSTAKKSTKITGAIDPSTDVDTEF